MLRTIMITTGLLVLWLLMSGLYKPLLIGFGIISSIIAVYFIKRMDKADGDSQLDYDIRPIEIIKYTFWLLIEIAKSNWAVTKIIMTPGIPGKQRVIEVPVSCETELGQVIYANSITLTPGTLTIETEDDHFLVHALSYSPGDIEDLAFMNDCVCKTEKGKS